VYLFRGGTISYIVGVSFIGGETGEKHWPVASHWQTLAHNVVSSTPHHEQESNSQLLVVIGTDYTGSCKSMTTTALAVF
jgi:hypothetical protein